MSKEFVKELPQMLEAIVTEADNLGGEVIGNLPRDNDIDAAIAPVNNGIIGVKDTNHLEQVRQILEQGLNSGNKIIEETKAYFLRILEERESQLQ